MNTRLFSLAAALALSASGAVLNSGALAQEALGRIPAEAPSPSVAASAVGHWLYDPLGNTIGSIRGLADGGRTAVIMVGSYFRPGSYAVQAFHDESGSGQIKLSLLGIPEEGVGFSRDAPIRFGGPSFADAAFQLPPAGGQVSLRLRHFD